MSRRLRVRASCSRVRSSVGIALLSLCSTAYAGEWYVDAAHGSDAKAGNAPALAWRTITHALAHVPTGTIERLHVAPGIYDAALGESFPLVVHGWNDKLQLIGDGGAASTIVDAGGAPAALLVLSDFFPLTAATRVEGFTLTNAATGLRVALVDRSNATVVREVEVTNCTTGIEFQAAAANFALDATLEDTVVRQCGRGLELQANAPVFARVTVRSSSFVANTAEGALVGRGATLHAQRSRFDGNGTHGLVLDAQEFAQASVALDDCALCGNTGDGLRLVNGISIGAAAAIERCTIARNVASGVSAGGPANTTALHQTIVFGNGDDLAPNGGTSASFCDIGDGDFAGVNGNLAADPLFVDAAGGDYRLRRTSPCIEAGDPSTLAGVHDLAGLARPIDGDLDTLRAFDIGAYEFAPLFPRTTGQIGSPLELELWCEPGQRVSVYWTQQGLVAPTTTSLGLSELERSAAAVFHSTAVGVTTPTLLRRWIPADPSLIGQTFGFQALVHSSNAPQGLALSNAFEITFTP